MQGVEDIGHPLDGGGSGDFAAAEDVIACGGEEAGLEVDDHELAVVGEVFYVPVAVEQEEDAGAAPAEVEPAIGSLMIHSANGARAAAVVILIGDDILHQGGVFWMCRMRGVGDAGVLLVALQPHGEVAEMDVPGAVELGGIHVRKGVEVHKQIETANGVGCRACSACLAGFLEAELFGIFRF